MEEGLNGPGPGKLGRLMGEGRIEQCWMEDKSGWSREHKLGWMGESRLQKEGVWEHR